MLTTLLPNFLQNPYATLSFARRWHWWHRYRRAGNLGLLGLGFPEDLGGTPADPFMRIVVNDEMAKAGSGGLLASLFSAGIGAPPIVHAGSRELQARTCRHILGCCICRQPTPISATPRCCRASNCLYGGVTVQWAIASSPDSHLLLLPLLGRAFYASFRAHSTPMRLHLTRTFVSSRLLPFTFDVSLRSWRWHLP